MDVIDLCGALGGGQRNIALSGKSCAFYKDGEIFLPDNYWELYEFTSIRRPHLGFIVSELKLPSDCLF